MAHVIKAPEALVTSGFTVFLSGSIDMGKAKDWQTEIADKLRDEDVILFNPRRDDWDDSWKQEMSFKPFREQVEWELNALEKADMIVVYFDKDGQAPITLMELGLHKDDDMVVCCPEGYFRKGNVDIVCHKYGIKQVDDIDGLVEEIKKRVKKEKKTVSETYLETFKKLI